MNDFSRVVDILPHYGRLVDWIAPDGQQVNGGKMMHKNLWFLPDGVYIYYIPISWRYSQSQPTQKSSSPSAASPSPGRSGTAE